MTHEEMLRQWFAGVQVNADFSEAMLAMRDGSQLSFRHRVGERWVKATGEESIGHAQQLLAAIARFRLNGKHLDIQFADGSRWELRFR